MVALAVALPAGADHCANSRLSVFSRAAVRAPDGSGATFAPPVAADANPVACSTPARDDEGADPRLIVPGANQVLVRYWRDFGPDVEALDATLDGLGFESRLIRLRRAEWLVAGAVPSGQTGYTTGDYLDLPDPSATGALTVRLTLPDGMTVTTTYHTAT